MNPFRASYKTQGTKPQNPYLSEQTCGVCLQNTYDYSPFGVSLDGRTMESDFYRIGFNGMEKDDEIKGEGNQVSWGNYGYDTRVVVRWSIDKYASKYTWQSPYSILGNNPILNKEKDGKDYTPYVNHDTKTITIKATYYTEIGKADDYNSAIEATTFWNEQGGKFQYKVGKGKEAILYDIVFDLEVKQMENPQKQLNIDKEEEQFFIELYEKEGKSKIISDGSSNIYKILPDNDAYFKNDDPNQSTNGTTSMGNYVRISESAKKGQTGRHELGHTLGFNHKDFTIMSEAININRLNIIDNSIVTRILTNAGLGINDVPESQKVTAKAKFQTEFGTAPLDFEKGKVVTKKK